MSETARDTQNVLSRTVKKYATSDHRREAVFVSCWGCPSSTRYVSEIRIAYLEACPSPGSDLSSSLTPADHVG